MSKLEPIDIYNGIINCFKRKQYRSVIPLFLNYISDNKNALDDNLIYIYGKSLFMMRKPEEALEVFLTLKKLYPKRGVNTQLGLIYLHLEDLDKALSHFKKEVEHYPDNNRVLFFLAKTYLLQEKYEDAYITLKLFFMNPDEIFAPIARLYLNEIEEYFLNGTFVECLCSTYLKKGNTLRVGQVVTLKDSLSKGCDLVVITSIIDEVITGRYIIGENEDLTKEEYPFLLKNKGISNNEVSFTTSNISKIVGELNIKDQERIRTKKI